MTEQDEIAELFIRMEAKLDLILEMLESMRRCCAASPMITSSPSVNAVHNANAVPTKSPTAWRSADLIIRARRRLSALADWHIAPGRSLTSVSLNARCATPSGTVDQSASLRRVHTP